MGNSIIEAQICLKEEQEKLNNHRLAHHGMMVKRHIPRMSTKWGWELDLDEMCSMEPKPKRKLNLIRRICHRLLLMVQR